MSLLLVSSCATQPAGPVSADQSKGIIATLTFNQFNASIPKIKTGMTKNQVLALLNRPNKQSADAWEYGNFPDKRTPVAGEIRYYGAAITFERTIISDIKSYWIDATGPATGK